MRIGIVGGGLMGLTLGYLLSSRGAEVEVFEAAALPGGLAGPVRLADGTLVDRFYHTILPSDAHLQALCAELGIVGQLRYRTTRTGFYYQKRIHSMNNVAEFLRFPPLGWIDRLRLGVTVVAAQLVRDWRRLEGVSVERWLVRLGGRLAFENVWGPMLRAKFDGSVVDDVPATWIWARLVRMKSARSGAAQQEGAGHLIGGYDTLNRALAEGIERHRGRVRLSCPVQEIVIEQGRATALRTGDQVHAFDAVAATVQAPLFRALIPGADEQYRDFLGRSAYLGVVCPLLVLDRPLTGYWTVNITDDRIPFTGIIETTAYIDPQYVGGHHLVYLPKYTAPGSEWLRKTDEEITDIWLTNLRAMFPDFDPAHIQEVRIHREQYVEPLHALNSTDLIPPVETPVQNLFLATTSQVYPSLTNGESVSVHARRVADVIFTLPRG